MTNRTPDFIKDPLTPEYFIINGRYDVPVLKRTPYGAWLKFMQKKVTDTESRRQDLERDDPSKLLEHSDRIKKALEDAASGKDVTELMRLMIPGFQSLQYEVDVEEYIPHDEIPSSLEARAFFLKMGEKAFTFDPEKSRFTLEGLWNLVSLIADTCPKEFKQPLIHDDKRLLNGLDSAIFDMQSQAEDLGLNSLLLRRNNNVKKGADIRLLWIMMKLQEHLNEKLYGRGDITLLEKREIEAQRKKLK